MTVIPNRLLALALVFFLSACATAPDDKKDDQKRMIRASRANVQLGVAYMRENELDTAMTKLKKAVDQDLRSVRAHDAIAVLYGRIDEDDLAEKHFKKALSLDSKDSRTHKTTGCTCARQVITPGRKRSSTRRPTIRCMPGGPPP